MKIRKGATYRGDKASESAVIERYQDRPHHHPPAHPDRQEPYTMAHIQNHQNPHQVSDVPESAFISRPIHSALSVAKPVHASLASFSGGNCDATGSMGDQRCSPGNTTRPDAYRPSEQTHPEVFFSIPLTGLAQMNQPDLRLHGHAMWESIMNPHGYGPYASQTPTYPQSDNNRNEATNSIWVGYQGQWSRETSYSGVLNPIQNQAIPLKWHNSALHSSQVTQAPAIMISGLPTGHGFRYAMIIMIS